ncbi:hypothetical protein YQE_03123, partial [Dendroctonus ponderosae]
MRLRQMTYTIIGQEDCLYLNVYTPQNPHAIRKLLPVMVWVYGGFFREGSASFYGPDYLMNESVLIVTFNYRTGFFECRNNYREAALWWAQRFPINPKSHLAFKRLKTRDRTGGLREKTLRRKCTATNENLAVRVLGDGVLDKKLACEISRSDSP